MSRPAILVDNLLNPRIYPSHTLSASSTAAGTHVLNLSRGSRVKGVNVGGWFASALNTLAWFSASFNRPRGFDLLFIDRDHNLDGQSISVQVSDDGFATYTEVGPKTVPTTTLPYAALYDGDIIRTDEGALLWYLGDQSGHEVRVVIAAMGADLRPELAGAMIGQSFAPGHAQIKPQGHGRPNLIRDVTRSAQAQSTSAEVGRFDEGTLKLRAETWFEYAVARYHFEDLYSGGRAMVLMHADEEAERAKLVIHPGGPRVYFETPENQFYPEISVEYEETEPVLL